MGKRFILRGLLFVALPVVVLELAFRFVLPGQVEGPRRLETFYTPAHEVLADRPVDALFVGSSRVTAAIDIPAFKAAMQEAGMGEVVALNLGQGYSTPAIHYLAIRQLFEQHPERMRGATIFVESPTGLPTGFTWDDRWLYEGWPTLLTPVMTGSDVGRFITQADNKFSDKMFAAGSKVSHTVRYWRLVRARATDALDAGLGSVLTEPRSEADASAESSELSSGGGIRTDSAGIAMVRQKAKDLERQIEELPLTKDWDQAVWADLADLARANGAEVVFFELPVTALERQAYTSPKRSAERAAFEAWRAANGVRLVSAGVTYPDEEFPDLWHLNLQKAPGFTRALAQAYVSAVHPQVASR